MKVCAKCGNPYKGFDICENCGSTEFKTIGNVDEDNLNDVINNTENSGDDKETAKIDENVVVTDNAENEKKTTHKKLPKKAKIAIISVVAVIVLLVAVVLGWYFYTTYANSINILNDTVNVEYGEEYTPSVDDFVEITSKVTENNTSLDYEFEYYSVIDDETGEVIETYSYPEVGEYEITIYHTVNYTIFGKTLFSNEVTETASVVVEDTTAPIFADDVATAINTYKDVELTETKLEKKFEATDYSEMTYSLDENVEIDYSTVGEYETTLYVTDEYDNVNTLEITVKVKKPTVKVSPSEVSLTVGDTKTLKVTVKGASDEVTFKSSDESVATVNSKGKITAVAKGTATITVTANDVSKKVTVTVTSETTSSGSSSSGSSSSGSSSSSKSSNSSTSSSSSSSSNKTSSSSSSTSSSSKSSSTNTNTNKGSTSSNNSTTNANSSSSSYTHSDCLKEGYTFFNSTEELVEYAEEMMLANDNIYGYKYYHCPL